MSSSNTFRKRQSSIIFAKGTKRHDGTGINTADAAGNSSRDSQVWAGVMMGEYSSDEESDSDHSDVGQSRSRVPAVSTSGSRGAAGNSDIRASWTTRAAAVGSRPPDNASQNPPSLKLLGLKSVKDGGIPMGNNGGRNQPPLSSPALSMRQQVEQRQIEQQRRNNQLRIDQQNDHRQKTPSPAFDMVDGENGIPRYPTAKKPENSRIDSGSDYGQDADRHGSMINFGATDGFGEANARRTDGMRGVELHDAPVRQFDQASSPERAQPTNSRPPLTLRPPNDPFANQPMSPTTALTHQLGLGSRTPSPIDGVRYGQPQQPNQRNLISPSAEQPRQGRVDPRFGPPSTSGDMGQNGEANSRRGPPPPLALTPGNGMSITQGSVRGGPPSPHPIPIPSPVHMPGQQRNMQDYNNMQAPQGRPRVPPGGMPRMQQPQQSSNFSDAPQGGPRQNAPARRPSLFRRSKAFLLGNSVPSQQPRPQQSQQQQQQQQQQRRSIFRKSMALFTGGRNDAGPGPMHIQQGSDSTEDDDLNAPAPRVQGFLDEKPRDRRSYFLGGGGMGDEWDYSGYGAKFWRRFSTAQHKLNAGEFKDLEERRKRIARRRKITMIVSLIGGLLIISAVVAVVIWREATPSSDVPGAIGRTAGGTDGSTGSSQGSNSKAATSTTTNNNAVSPVNDDTANTADAATGATGSNDDATTGTNADATEATTTTPKKHHKHHRHHGLEKLEEPVKPVKIVKTQKHQDDKDVNDDNNGNDDSIDDIGRRRSFDVSEGAKMIKRQVEQIIPSTRMMKPIEMRASLQSETSMIRRRRNLMEGMQS